MDTSNSKLSEKLTNEFMEQLAIRKKQHIEMGKMVGFIDGRKDGAATVIVAILAHRFGSLSHEAQERIEQLSFFALEALAVDLLDFANLADLQLWFGENL